jgi:RHS repeat-associated protein
MKKSSSSRSRMTHLGRRNNSDPFNYFLGDHLSVSIVASGNTFNLGSERRYKAWGEMNYSTGSVSNAGFSFTGQRRQVELELLFYQARWYDPALGRFTQADTIVPNPYHPASFDRYAYTENNPVNRIDPSGHMYQDPNDNQRHKSLLTNDEFFDASMGLPMKDPTVSTLLGFHNTCDNGEYKEFNKRIQNAKTDGEKNGIINEYLKKWGIHPGVDLVASDVNLYAVWDGVVVGIITDDDNGGYKIIIEHKVGGEKYYSVYFHCKEDSATIAGLSVGTYVTQGQLIGEMGDTGSNGVVHLHFEVRTTQGINTMSGAYIGFPLSVDSFWANDSVEFHMKWVDISSRFGGYDPFFPEAWK